MATGEYDCRRNWILIISIVSKHLGRSGELW